MASVIVRIGSGLELSGSFLRITIDLNWLLVPTPPIVLQLSLQVKKVRYKGTCVI